MRPCFVKIAVDRRPLGNARRGHSTIHGHPSPNISPDEPIGGGGPQRNELVSADRAERAALATTPFLDTLEAPRKRELIGQATEFIKERGSSEGMMSDPDAVPTHLTRAQRRQIARELGFRGSKAKRHNIEKRLPQVQQALVMDQALTAAAARMEMGPIERARFRHNERKAS